MHETFRPHTDSSLDVCSIRQRNAEIHEACDPLPGSLPYDNLRPINVPARYEGQTLFQCVCAMHPHVGDEQWREWFRSGLILDGESAASMDRSVRGGQQYWHVFPDTIEPDVDASIQVLWEDDAIVAIHKPAPLPVHPCGRYNFNTLTSLLARVYGAGHLRLVHRLDANTTGVMLLARTADVATYMRARFERNEIRKRYIVRCHGTPRDDALRCDQPISRQRSRAGTRDVDFSGDRAHTEIKVKHRFDDGTTLVEACPTTGRTNQIRIHLWALGLPVMGDRAYLQGHRRAASQTIDVKDPPMCLHAAELSFVHPISGRVLRIEAAVPSWASEGIDLI